VDFPLLDSNLGVNTEEKAFPTLSGAPTNPAVIKTGTTITLLTPGYLVEAADGSSPIYAAFITVTGM
jgi:hypothetical protein